MPTPWQAERDEVRHGMSARLAEEALARPPVPDSPAYLLGTVQRLYHELSLASPATRPFLEREIRAYADRYRACADEDRTLC